MSVGSGDGALSGEVVTETFEYDGGRQVTVYVPRRPPQAIVYAGDGQVISPWGADLETTDLPPTMVVGVHRPADETQRLHEYSPGFDPERFAAHESFFVEDVRRWTRTRFGVSLPAERTAVLGVSASGGALAMGLRHAGVFGAVLCASPGAGYRPPTAMPHPLPRAYLVAGTQEPFFLENATRWATALRDAGADVVLEERAGSHGDPFWRKELPADGGVGLRVARNRARERPVAEGAVASSPEHRRRGRAVSAGDIYPPGPPGTAPSASDRYFVGLTYSRAKNAFWLGVFSLICFGPLTGIPAVYVGVRALRDIAASRGGLKGRAAAWEGIVLGVIGSFVDVGVYWHILA